MHSKDFRKIITDRLVLTLKPKGFKRNGNVFSLSNGDLTYFVNTQSSQSSTASVLNITVNVEIFSSVVYQLEDTGKPEKWSRHFTKRIGHMLEEPQDKWWVIGNVKEANDAADEMAAIIQNSVLPMFDELKTTTDLATLWRQNKCPGLTEGQRKEYLQLLDNVK